VNDSWAEMMGSSRTGTGLDRSSSWMDGQSVGTTETRRRVRRGCGPCECLSVNGTEGEQCGLNWVGLRRVMGVNWEAAQM